MMSSWIIYLVAASQIIVLYWITAAANFCLIRRTFFGKNLQWVEQNPAFLQRHPAPRGAVRLSHVIGIAWLAGLCMLFFSGTDDRWLTAALIVPALAWAALGFGYMGIAYLRIYREIPLPSRRGASLGPRMLGNFIHPAWVYLCYLLLAIVAGAYAAALCRGLIDTDLFAVRMTGLTAGVTIGSAMLVHGVRRKKEAIDDAWPASRKIEIVCTVLVLYLIAVIGALRILQDVFAIYLVRDVTFSAITCVLGQACWLFCTTRPSVKAWLAECF